jgi:hypothetical protein
VGSGSTKGCGGGGGSKSMKMFQNEATNVGRTEKKLELRYKMVWSSVRPVCSLVNIPDI